MIPDKPRDFNPYSKEDVMFEELNTLSNDYYVFHSFKIVNVKNSVITESEADFVIFHPKKGILCIEAKAGQVDYVNGCWKYGSGEEMKHDGPYNQAARNKWKIKDAILDHGLEQEYRHCKLLHAVWFPDVPMSRLKSKNLPAEADLAITLTSDTFGHIQDEIDKIFNIELNAGIETSLSEKETQRILNHVLAPSFDLISLQEVQKARSQHVFKKMLREQKALLNYLEEQNSAVINGLAGTGKTVMAVEKARRHSEKNESVLFLCYNVLLKEHLKKEYNYPMVSYYTIDGLACKLCNTGKPDYALLKEKLEEMYLASSFPYQHVIIDEGQDFGKESLEEIEIIDLLKCITIDNENRKGSFYLFYDKNQVVQADKLPAYIMDADCKLTLYRNCRNTENIALTSLRLLRSNQSPKLLPDSVRGEVPEMSFCNGKTETVNCINAIVDKNLEDGYTNITILTAKTEEQSIISDCCNDSKYHYQKGYVQFTTCRKFKGLESDVIILVDITPDEFNEKGEQRMYVGSSRARFRLYCIANMDEDECIQVMENYKTKYNKKNIFKSFATAFNSKLMKSD